MISCVCYKMYTKVMPTFTCLSRFLHRLSPNADGRRNLFSSVLTTVYKHNGSRNGTLSVINISNSVLKRHHSSCNKQHVVDCRVAFYNCFQSFNCEFLKSDDLRTGCFSFVSNARRRTYVSVTQFGMVRGSVTTGSSVLKLKPLGDRTSRGCCFYTTDVSADGQGRPEDQVLETLAKKIIESARKTDVMAGSVPVRKVVALLEALRHQGFTLDHMTVLSQQLQFLRDPDSLTSLTELLLSHGLQHSSIILFLKNIPFMENNTALKQLKSSTDDSIKYLRVLGFSEADINSFLKTEPRVFFTDAKTLNFVFSQLKGMFSGADVLCVIRSSPNVFCDSWEETKEKFDYVYFEMQYKQAAVLKCFLFQHGLDHIVDRHQFLLRAGLFHSVKEKDDPRINPNPPLADVLDTPDKVFVRQFGGFGMEEYRVYLQMRDVEREADADSASDDDDDSDASDEEDETEEKKDTFRKKAKNRQLKRK